MYERFYGLEKAPFHITPDPEFLFLSPTHKEALASIVYGVEGRKGFVVIVGEVGLGKTTILRSYLEQVNKKRLRIIYIFNPNAPFSALLDTIERAVGLDGRPEDEVAARVQRLHELLIEEYRQERNVVLVVDEAQNMPVETLENLRLLSNLETSKDKLIQLALIGSPELDRLLDRHELRHLKQRTAVRSTLAPLDARESLAYIRYRLGKAGVGPSRVFTQRALRRIVKHAKGIPRTINILCDNALVTGFGYRKQPVTAAIVREVVADLTGGSASRLWRWKVALVGALLIIGGLFLAGPKMPQPAGGSRLPAPAQPPQPVLIERPTALSPMPALSASVAPLSVKTATEAAAAPTPALRPSISTPPPADKAVPERTRHAEKRPARSQAAPRVRSAQAETAPPVIPARPPVAVPAPPPAPAPSAPPVVSGPTSPPPTRSEPGAQRREAPSSGAEAPDPGEMIDWLLKRRRQAGSPGSSDMARAVEAAAATEPNSGVVATHVVEPGDDLCRLAETVYGICQPEVVDAIVRNNPGIRNRDLLPIGMRIRFPDIAAKRAGP